MQALVLKKDFKTSNGNCAACHVPAMALKNPFDSNPNDAEGVEKEGIFCDFCHKIEGVKIDETGGYPGILSYSFRRPDKGHQVFYGPYDDVYPGEDSRHPLYSKSHYCAPCHHGKFWDVLAYSEFQEWLDSDYSRKNIHCQDCHMKSENRLSRFALKSQGGILRDTATIPSHANFGIKDKAFMKEAVSLTTTAKICGNALKVLVKTENTNAGHHYPTGNPMRNMILLVEAKDGKGRPCEQISGEKIPLWGGQGSPEKGNFAGLPGKGFAKVLRDRRIYDGRKKRKKFIKEYPASHWRPVVVESDNRIPAYGCDLSTFGFRLPLDAGGSDNPVTVRTTLIFRRTYKAWADLKGVEANDMVIGKNYLFLRRDGDDVLQQQQ